MERSGARPKGTTKESFIDKVDREDKIIQIPSVSHGQIKFGKYKKDGYTGHCPGLRFADVGHSYGWTVRHMGEIQLNTRMPAGHLVVTPHGQTVAQTGSGPPDVDASSGPQPVTVVSPTSYRPNSCRAIAGYTGHIPQYAQQVGVNYRSVAESYYTDLERQSLDRRSRLVKEKAAKVPEVGGGVGGGDSDTTSTAPTPAPAQENANKYSRYNTYMDNGVPITGYGGFVPKARTSSMGVGKSFHRFADEGFSALHDQVSHYRQVARA